MLDHVYRNPSKQGEAEGEIRNPNSFVLAMIAARYPHELKRIYLEALESKKPIESRSILNAILHSTLDKQTKRELLNSGLIQSTYDQRYYAEVFLSEFDPEAYSTRLLKRIEKIPMKDNDLDKPFETEMSILCFKSKDPKVWTAIERAIRRSPTLLRFQLLNGLALSYEDHETPRNEIIRILAAFLDDKTVRTSEELKKKRPYDIRDFYDTIELRNYCVVLLAPFFAEWIDDDEHRSDDEWAYLRKWIKDEVENELKQPMPVKAKP